MHILQKCQKTFERLSSEWAFFAGAAAGVLAPAAVLPALVFLPLRASLWLLLGCLGSLIFSGSDPSPEKLFNGRPAEIEYLVEIADVRQSCVTGLDKHSGVHAVLHQAGFAGETWKKCGSKIIFYPEMPVEPVYGGLFRGRGILSPPPEGAFSPLWSLRSDLPVSAGVRRSFRHYLMKWRDVLLKHLTSGIDDDTNRNLAAAFFLGSTGGLTGERRQLFAEAGTVHLFAVSGLHVGMMTLLLMVVLKFFPFRLRYYLCALLTAVYVLLTGAAVPAMRAGFMICVFLICRGSLFHVSPWRLLGMAGGLIIIADPDSLYSIGFHYSFFITAVLILLGKNLKEFYENDSAVLQLMPRGKEYRDQKRVLHWRFLLLSGITGGITAAAAGSVVSMFHCVFVTPGAAAANWLTMPLLGILFAMMPLKIAASFLPDGVNDLTGDVISGAFHYLRTIAEVTGELAAPFYADPPGIWLSLVLAGLLLAALHFRGRRQCGTVLLFAVMLCAFPLRGLIRDDAVTVISSHSGVPVTVVITESRFGEGTVINPVYDHSAEVEKVLKKHGIHTVSGVLVTRPSVRNISGLRRLYRKFRISRIVMPARRRGDWKFRDRIMEDPAAFRLSDQEYAGEKCRLFAEKNKITIDYPLFGDMLRKGPGGTVPGVTIENSDRGRLVTFRGRGKAERKLLPWSDKCGVYSNEL